jgi:hypothetical protein
MVPPQTEALALAQRNVLPARVFQTEVHICREDARFGATAHLESLVIFPCSLVGGGIGGSGTDLWSVTVDILRAVSVNWLRSRGWDVSGER